MNEVKKNGFTLVLFLLLSFSGTTCLGQMNYVVTDGLCDIRQKDLSTEIIALSGNWNFYPSVLELSKQLAKEKKAIKIVPSVWNDFNKEKKGTGYGTYSVKIILPGNAREVALAIPQLYSSYALFINDSLVARNGIIGKSKEESVAEWKPQVVIFSVNRDTIDVILQVSNFSHHKGGIREPILFGSASTIADHHKKGLYSTITLTGFVGAISSLFLFLFMFKKKEKETLYFGLFCLAWSVRLMFTDLYAITQFVNNINWNFQVRAEYISLNLIMIFATLFLSKLFRDLSSKIFLALVLIINGLLIGFSIIAEPILFTHWLNLYIGMAVIILIYGAVMVIRALMQDQTGAWSLIAAIILAILVMGYDVIAFNGIVVNNLLTKNIGYGLIFISLSIGILQHLGIVKGEKPVNRKLSIEDFYRKS